MHEREGTKRGAIAICVCICLRKRACIRAYTSTNVNICTCGRASVRCASPPCAQRIRANIYECVKCTRVYMCVWSRKVVALNARRLDARPVAGNNRAISSSLVPTLNLPKPPQCAAASLITSPRSGFAAVVVRSGFPRVVMPYCSGSKTEHECTPRALQGDMCACICMCVCACVCVYVLAVYHLHVQRV